MLFSSLPQLERANELMLQPSPCKQVDLQRFSGRGEDDCFVPNTIAFGLCSFAVDFKEQPPTIMLRKNRIRSVFQLDDGAPQLQIVLHFHGQQQMNSSLDRRKIRTSRKLPLQLMMRVFFFFF